MRNPSLHILRSDLIKVLQQTIDVKNYEKLADEMLRLSIPYQVKNRYLVKGNAKTVKQAKRTVEASTNIEGYSPEQFNGLLSAMRQQAGHRFMQKISKGTAEWNTLKEVTLIASEFVKAFGFVPVETGYKTFITLGLNLMGRKYALNKFKFYGTKIHDQYEAQKVIDDDDNEDGTLKFWQVWCAKMEEYTDGSLDILKPHLFVNMIYGRQEADENNAKYEDWITAQFEEMAFLTAVPELAHFHGDNAAHRYKKYMAKKKAPVRKTGRKAEEEEETYNAPVGVSAEQDEYFKNLKALSRKR